MDGCRHRAGALYLSFLDKARPDHWPRVVTHSWPTRIHAPRRRQTRELRQCYTYPLVHRRFIHLANHLQYPVNPSMTFPVRRPFWLLLWQGLLHSTSTPPSASFTCRALQRFGPP